METFAISMTLLGAVAIIAAIAGALNIAGVAEIPAMASRTLRVLLFLFGGLFFLIGLGSFAAPLDDETGPGPDRGPSTSAPPPTTPPHDPNWAYVQAANAACQESNRAYESYPEPPEGAGDEENEQWAKVWGDITAQLANRLHAIEPPASLQEDHDAAVFRLDNLADSLTSAGVALGAGDPWGYDQNLANAESHALEFNRITQYTLGLSECAW